MMQVPEAELRGAGAGSSPAAPVEIREYDPNWPALFQELSVPIRSALKELVVAIEHVGSTAVPGLAAKPIIDMDVVIRSDADFAMVVQRLARLGYTHQGDLGVPGRDSFQSLPSTPKHHLYACRVDSEALRCHLVFRDYLRNDPEAASAYATLKRDAASRFRHDRQAYTAAKSQFVDEALRAAQVAVDSSES
jgi:GrpB-like predicted nucleotidyltransferase (UPF0157 family)